MRVSAGRRGRSAHAGAEPLPEAEALFGAPAAVTGPDSSSSQVNETGSLVSVRGPMNTRSGHNQ